MASDPKNSPDGRVGGSPACLPRDHILPQVTPTEGWTRDWRPVIDELSEIVVERYPDANLEVLRQRLAPLLTKTVDMVEVGQPEGKKPATFIRDQIKSLRIIPSVKAVKALQHPHRALRDYLDTKSEAQNAKIDRRADPALSSKRRAAKRYALVMALEHDIQPQPRIGTESPWATVAALVAELLADATGEEPKRSWDDYAQSDTGWSLAFFRRFAELAVASTEQPTLEKIWRNALDARKKLKTAI